MKALSDWFLEHQRSFPWRKTRSFYEVWISEIMLQQTRASVVIPYFIRWMNQFPTIESLAEASIEEIFSLWQGLGYYNRARNLKIAAGQIVARGAIPKSKEELLSLKGIGTYTAGAILSFAFHQKAAAVDGNVRRVISRYTGSELQIEAKTLSFLPDDKPWVTMEALIELGATICTPIPSCSTCPLQNNCIAKKEHKQLELPPKKTYKQKIHLQTEVAVIESQDRILLFQKKEGDLLGGLWQFPSFTYEATSSLEDRIEKKLSLTVHLLHLLPKQSQTFTHFKEELFPSYLQAEVPKSLPGYEWVSKQELSQKTFSSGHLRILHSL